MIIYFALISSLPHYDWHHPENEYFAENSLLQAYNDHVVGCSSGSEVSFGLGCSRSYATSDTLSTKGLTTRYDKYGNVIDGVGLMKANGFLDQQGLSRILSASLESGQDAKNGAFSSYLDVFKNKFANQGSSGSVGGYGSNSGMAIRGYSEHNDQSLLMSGNKDVEANIRCDLSENGYGHPHCSDDKIVGEHIDLTTSKGKHKMNAHMESPSKVHQPINSESYHPYRHTGSLASRVSSGNKESNILWQRFKTGCQNSDCSNQFPAKRRGVRQFISPADEFQSLNDHHN